MLVSHRILKLFKEIKLARLKKKQTSLNPSFTFPPQITASIFKPMLALALSITCINSQYFISNFLCMFYRTLFSSGFPSPVTAAGKERASLTLPGWSKNLGVVSSGFWVPMCLLWESCGHFPAICSQVPWTRGAMYWPPGPSRFRCGSVNAPVLQGEALLPRTRLENSKLAMPLRSLFKRSIRGFGDRMCFFWNIGRE